LLAPQNIVQWKKELKDGGMDQASQCYCDNKSLSKIKISYSKIVGGKDKRII